MKVICTTPGIQSKVLRTAGPEDIEFDVPPGFTIAAGRKGSRLRVELNESKVSKSTFNWIVAGNWSSRGNKNAGRCVTTCNIFSEGNA
jgi:hypothetical protein